ncbi:MAG: quinolinate synthase NadA [Actinobacteria bacterium]|nr:quinolinate synthase NadA [Actinomycetota bacterium]MBU4386067.1 quinolinate synthase NadA [Actinomycetota bacterium]MBU4490527.1 quinolinate synthase NadA [Actinomycetota bacterium]
MPGSEESDTDIILERSLVDDETLVGLIIEEKRRKNAVILVHNYQRPEIQDIGDFIGDSLGLALKASETDSDVIVFCGVHFMAETAAIVNPDRIVLLPEIRAGCPMADMAPLDAVRKAKRLHPNAKVISYVNTTAAVKAESDYCCTSSNAVRVTQEVDADEILFLPDQNLAGYVAKQVTDKRIIPWEGYCHVHQGITAEHVLEALEKHPGAETIAHPECTDEILSIADHIRSTSGMVAAAQESSATEFIVATESGMIYPLKRAVPSKSFYPTANEPLCPNMKLITLSKVLWALETLEPRVVVPREVRARALIPVEKMLSL